MVLEVTFPTVPTFEPAATPHQRGAAAAHPQVTNPLGPSVPHPIAAEPTMAAPRPLPSRFDFNLKTLNRVDQHSHHTNTRQVQPNGHNIRHRGLSLDSAMLAIHRFQRGLTPIPRISPHPTHVFAQGPDVAYQHPIMEDPPSLLVDYHSPWQIPYSPLISEEPLIVGLNPELAASTQVTPCYASDSASAG